MSCENMKSLMAFSLLSTLLVKISVASSEAAIDDSLANDDIFANTYSDLDPFSTPDDGFQGSPWDESLITDADPYSGFLADADIGCSGTIEPPAKRRRDNYCDPQVPPADLRLALPQNPFETLEQKNRINLDLDPIRFPGGAPQFTQMDNLYCGSSQFVVCDSGRENDKKPKGNGKYRLQNAKRVLRGSLCVSPYSIWCCDNYFPASPGDGQQFIDGVGAGAGAGAGAQQEHDVLNGDGNGGLNDFGLPDTTFVQTDQGGVADSCIYFVTLP